MNSVGAAVRYQLPAYTNPSAIEEIDGVAQDKEGVWQYQGSICVPEGDSLRNKILEESHKSEFTVHPRINKMYQDLKRMFWWPGMKSDVANFVNKCLIC